MALCAALSGIKYNSVGLVAFVMALLLKGQVLNESEYSLLITNASDVLMLIGDCAKVRIVGNVIGLFYVLIIISRIVVHS